MTIVEIGMRDSGSDYKKVHVGWSQWRTLSPQAEFTGGAAAGLRCNLTLSASKLSKGEQDEISIDGRRRRCRGSFRNSGHGAGCYRSPRLLRSVLSQRQLPV